MAPKRSKKSKKTSAKGNAKNSIKSLPAQPKKEDTTPQGHNVVFSEPPAVDENFERVMTDLLKPKPRVQHTKSPAEEQYADAMQRSHLQRQWELPDPNLEQYSELEAFEKKKQLFLEKQSRLNEERDALAQEYQEWVKETTDREIERRLKGFK